MPSPRRLGRAFVLLLLISGCAAGDDPLPSTTSGDAAAETERSPASRGAHDSGRDRVQDGGAGRQRDSERDGEIDAPHLDVGLALESVARLPAPIATAVTPGGDVLVASRDGTVRRLEEGSSSPPLVLDISAQTTTDGERGLLDIAMSADGDEFYVSFTDVEGDTRVDAYAMDGRARLGAHRTVFTHPQPYANHNGGGLQVSADGMLYLGLGDGGGAGDPNGAGQDLTTALGSLVRIDPRSADPYRVPEDNPFVGHPDAVDEIFATGLRNPWRFTIDEPTGYLWIADVGQGAREEVNRIRLEDAKGANFGWNRMEGTTVFAGREPDDHVPPVYEYGTRSDQGCAITGGLVYRGSAIPELRGAYLYADFCDGELRGLVVDARGEVSQQAGLGVAGSQVVGFGKDADDEVLVLDLSGEVLRLVPG